MLLIRGNLRRKREFLEWSVPFGELYASEWMVVLADDMNGHVGSSNVGYNGTHGGFWYGDRNADGSRILEFANGLNLVICNTSIMKQESQLVTYAAGAVKSTVDYIIVWQEDKAKRKLLVMNMRFNTTIRWHNTPIQGHHPIISCNIKI